MTRTIDRAMVAAAVGSLLAGGLCLVGLAAEPAAQPVRSARQIENDWLRQDQVRGVATPGGPGAVSVEQDALGACDGVRSGGYGFHTAREDQPWWQVDLGVVRALDEIMVYNRCDACAERAARLVILLSLDAKSWRQVYQHDGTTFFGHIDDRPLTVMLGGKKARYVRLQLPQADTCLHLDEVEIFPVGNHRNIALRRPASQSSTSRWSTRTDPPLAHAEKYSIAHVLRRGFLLAESLGPLGVDVAPPVETLREIARQADQLAPHAPEQARRALYLRARRTVRKLALANPLLDFDDLLLVKRVPAQFKVSPTSRTYTHMSDQYYGWFSRPGGGLYVLENFKSPSPRLRCLSVELPPGTVLRPDVSYDGRRVLFAYCHYHPQVHDLANKLDKSLIPEDAFYHLYEINLDGTGLRRLTHGKHDDFDGRYLPDGRIVLLSTRRGDRVQCDPAAVAGGASESGDCYVRCGGDEYRPVAVYTLHVMDAGGGVPRPISSFAMFEWNPSVDHDGRILYSRWDYVDREAMPYMSLWSTMPDGTGTRAVFGNHTINPHCMFEPRAIPASQKIVFTASAHHSNTGGSLVLLDWRKGSDGNGAMTRLTPEVPFPEIEAWPDTYYVNPYPLSEDHYLVAWSDQPLRSEGHAAGAAPLGIYLYDRFGNLELLYRDPAISSMYPLPIRPRRRPPRTASVVDGDGSREGRVLVADVYQGLDGVAPGSIRALRLVGIAPKDHPVMNSPVMGLTGHDPGKFVLGTVPVEEDGSAHFRVPSGVPLFVQALDARGMAVETMRSAIYLQSGEKLSCIGCHEPRNTAPPVRRPLAARREPSRITPGPPGSWPIDFLTLVQPVMEKHCVGCHRPGAEGKEFDLTAANSYDSLTGYGNPSLRAHVVTRHRQGRSVAGACAAATSPLLALVDRGHHDVVLPPRDRERIVTWMDTYAQRRGSFSDREDDHLQQLRRRMAALLAD